MTITRSPTATRTPTQLDFLGTNWILSDNDVDCVNLTRVDEKSNSFYSDRYHAADFRSGGKSCEAWSPPNSTEKLYSRGNIDIVFVPADLASALDGHLADSFPQQGIRNGVVLFAPSWGNENIPFVPLNNQTPTPAPLSDRLPPYRLTCVYVGYVYDNNTAQGFTRCLGPKAAPDIVEKWWAKIMGPATAQMPEVPPPNVWLEREQPGETGEDRGIFVPLGTSDAFVSIWWHVNPDGDIDLSRGLTIADMRIATRGSYVHAERTNTNQGLWCAYDGTLESRNVNGQVWCWWDNYEIQSSPPYPRTWCAVIVTPENWESRAISDTTSVSATFLGDLTDKCPLTALPTSTPTPDF